MWGILTVQAEDSNTEPPEGKKERGSGSVTAQNGYKNGVIA